MKRKNLMVVVVSLLAIAVAPSWVNAQSTNSKTRRHTRYRLVDISLGGPSSVSLPIGKDGTVIGTSCLDAACAIIHAFRWDKGVLTDLGALPGENSSIPTWINDHGRCIEDCDR